MPATRISFTQGAYTARSVIAAAQRCVNLYPERNPAGEDSPSTLYPTPGLTRLGVPAQADTVRGLYRATNGQGFAAIGNGLYYVHSNWTTTLLGTTASGTTPVKMNDNGATMVVVDGSAFGWSVDLTSHVFAAIADPDFYGSNFVEEMDTYLLFNKPGTPIFYCSDSNAITFDPLFFAEKTGYADSVAGIAVQNRNMWVIGNQSSSELWYNAGAADFPFARMDGPFVQHGTIAIYSIARQGGAVFWLGQDENGTSFVIQVTDFKDQKISTPAIEAAIASYPTISDAVGFCYEQLGHAFYWLKFPSANGGLGADWVYDLTTGLWHERSWLNPATCEAEGHRAFCSAFMYGVNVVGDRETGQLYMLDPNNATDAGDFVERRRGYPHMMTDGSRVSYPSFVADMQPGVDGIASASAGLPAGLASSAVYPATVTVIETTFTAPNGTLLQDYFSPWGLVDTGSQYTKISGSVNGEIETDVLTGSGSGNAEYLASGTPTSADYIANFQAIPKDYFTAGASGAGVYLVGRADASNNGYKLAITGDGTGFNAELVVMGGSTVSVAAGTLTSGLFLAYLSMQGDTIAGAVQRSQDGTWLSPLGVWGTAFQTFASITDTTYQTAGRVLIGGAW